MSPRTVYQIKVTLDDSKPPIWRRLLLADTTTLGELHEILQIAMGWENYHLHMFIMGEQIYGDPEDDETGEIGTKSEKRVRLNQIVNREGFKFRYEYDFGDSWDHTLLVEKILPAEKGTHYPVCIAGKRACPPEDVGGVWGYDDFLQAIADPKHKMHDRYIESIGGEFDPEAFDMEEVNAALQNLTRGAQDELDELDGSNEFEELKEEFPLTEGEACKIDQFILWAQKLTSKQAKKFDSLALHLDMRAFLTYLIENRTVGTQSTGNLPLKAVRAICEKFVHPPALKEMLGDYTRTVRSEDDVWPLLYIHTLAHASGLVTGGPSQTWKVTEEGQMYLQLPGIIGIFFLLASWWGGVDWIMAFPFEGFSKGLPMGFNKHTLTCLLELPSGKMSSYEAFADTLIKLSGLVWPIQDQVSARRILHSAIKRMVVDPLVTFGMMETKYGKEKIGNTEFDKLVSIRLTPVGRGMLELLT